MAAPERDDSGGGGFPPGLTEAERALIVAVAGDWPTFVRQVAEAREQAPPPTPEQQRKIERGVRALVEAGRVQGRAALERELDEADTFADACDDLAGDIVFTTQDRERFDAAVDELRNWISLGRDLPFTDAYLAEYHDAIGRLQAARATARAAFNEAAESSS